MRLDAIPGEPWLLPDPFTTEPPEPEIPMPDDVVALAQAWDETLESLLGLNGTPITGITLTICRTVWAEISATIMRARRHMYATTGAATELDYYQDPPALRETHRL
jgi:hypothetical protein